MSHDDAPLREALDVLSRANFRDIQRLGYHVQPNDFYSPLNDCEFLEANRAVWHERLPPAEVDWNSDGQIASIREVGAFCEELRDVPDEEPEPGAFFWNNQFFNRADAVASYGFARSRQPKRWFEIGCGYSSLVLQMALERNEQPCDVTLIEPYPNRTIFDRLPKGWRHGETILQHVPLEEFEALEAGDVLFYDGSHCSKVGSDVNYFFFKLLPRLKPGVLIHIHDIFFPDPYPEAWIFERGQTWNEQFVLQAFLMHNDAYEVTLGNHWVHAFHRDELERSYTVLDDQYGCSFWMTKRR